MPNDIDKLIRIAIKDVIQPSYPAAVIYPWNALSHDLQEWPGLFRTAGGITHGWIVKRADASGDWKNAGRDRRTFVYDVWGFYGFRSGKQGDNSDDEFSVICETAYADLKAAPRLNFDETVEKHDLLQFRTTTLNTGEATLHFAQGRLTVHLCC